jgi:hypothetical protein
VEVFDPASTRVSNIDECTAVYKMPENLIEIAAFQGSITTVHVCVVPDRPVIPW